MRPYNQLNYRLLSACTFASLLLAGIGAAAQAEEIDFAEDIRPILAEHCYRCHGSDRQQAGLRLDTRQRALRGSDSGRVIVPGDSAVSPLVARITAADPKQRMPRGSDPLSPHQVELMKRWIEAGAPWPDELAGDEQVQSDHWAFAPPACPPLPTVEDGRWLRNPIDAFVLARLEQEQLRPSVEADRYMLIRRLYLDLLGVLPTVDEAELFVHDPRPDAYERLVDRLLASPLYGERWARHWLDLARYADTNGYEKDRTRSIWPYRDWVIDAINQDLPFDQFTIQQIAGDMLPDATLDQRIATGFHRNTMTNEEGGIDVGEFRYHAVVDRVATTGTTWLGLTVACAQCHTHKYDPITQHEYYEFFAFLNNADEPDLKVPDPEITRQQAELKAQIAQLEAGLLEEELPRLRAEGKYQQWLSEVVPKATNWTVVSPTEVVSEHGATMTMLADSSVLASGDIPNNDVYVVTFPAPAGPVTALRLEVLPHASLPQQGPGRAVFTSGAGEEGDFLLSEVTLEVQDPDEQQAWNLLPLSAASHSYAAEKKPASQTIDGTLDTGWSVAGRMGEPHHIVLQLEQPLEEVAGHALRLTLNQHYIHQMTIGRFRVSVTQDAQPVESSGVAAELEQLLVRLAGDESLAPDEQRSLERHYVSAAPELAEQHKEIAKLRGQMPEQPTTLVMTQRSDEHRRTTRIHQRGEYLRTADAVQPDTPDVLHPLPAGQPRNRLTLAHWLVSEDNPLVGRVVINRHWQHFFGRGVVETVGDFGTQGAMPTHPELLDWLAMEWMSGDWSIKRMHRLIVTSATYRQSSAISGPLRERDPDNRLLARGPRARVEAEVVRDLALSASGLLQHRLGGPSVYPPQPEGVNALSYGNFNWETSEGADRYRRGLYTFMKRTSPYAAFALFDGPSGEICVASRSRSNTPLQALTLLNDTVFIEAGRALAAGALTGPQRTDQQRAVRLFQRCLTRPPDQVELDWIVAFYRGQLARFTAGELKAEEVAGQSPEITSDQRAELAAWTTVARALLNVDAFVTKE